jgi:hypothetical protein
MDLDFDLDDLPLGPEGSVRPRSKSHSFGHMVESAWRLPPRSFPSAPPAPWVTSAVPKATVGAVLAKTTAPQLEKGFFQTAADALEFTAADRTFVKGAGIAVAGLTAAGVAAWLAFGRRGDRQTQVTGLPEGGLAAQVRHKMTSFGSGYRGLDAQPNPYQLESEQAYSPTLRILGAGVAGGIGYLAHHQMLATYPGYAKKLQHYARLFEERTPAHIGRTFTMS